ncbi:glycosyltransferase [Kitasatospora sp. NBC_01287]|uniref:glycosyltransferase n=1 Tax=Kitasatospora sp. NBC_01287 TaxID=2903573 RepID=UPI00225183B4|nr:glycosyltransferase [Kitasatospora sp. NBC_01287]MCX4744420.1 glycosyltransferase [Kitasatospora sp. NBC_01287]
MNVLLCPLVDPGYRYPSIAVGLELSRRGHTVRLLQPTPEPAAGTPEELVPCPVEDLADPRTFRVRRWFMYGLPQFEAVVRAARETRAEVLVTSVLCHGALLAAEFLDIPVVVLGLAAHLWPYQEPAPGGAVGAVGAGGAVGAEERRQRRWRVGETLAPYRRAREEAGLAPYPDGRQEQRALLGSGLLLRGDPALEVPGAVLPEGVRQVGPCWWEPSAPQDELDAIDAATGRVGKPVVYVHLGRSFGGNSLWPWLNETFRDSPYQAVVELGRSGAAQQAPGTDILVVRKPWLAPLVERSAVVLTNATTAPVLGALLGGRPLLVAPAGGEQHVLAAACLRAGAARRLPAGVDPAPAPTGDDVADGAAERPVDGAALIAAAHGDHAVREGVRLLGERLRQAKSEAVAADLVEVAAR